MSRLLLCVAMIGLVFGLSGCALSESKTKQASYHFQMGLSHLGENNIPSALTELTEAEKITPDDPDLLHYLGQAYYRKNRFELAEQKYLRALALKPTYSEARNSLGVNYLEMKRWDDAIYHFKLVIDDIFYPNQETANINLGLAYFGKGDYPKALSIFRSAVNANTRNPRARLNLGKVYFALDKVELAIGEFKKAVELNKEFANAYYQLGLAYLKIKESGLARNSFGEVLRIAPDTEMGQLSRDYLELLK